MPVFPLLRPWCLLEIATDLFTIGTDSRGEMVKKVSGHDGAVTAMNYNFMSSLLASADKEGSLIIWQ